MKRFNQILFLFFTFILLVGSFSSPVFAQENITSASQQVMFELYDENGCLISTGILPMSEKEAYSRETHPSTTLANGQTLILKSRTTQLPYAVIPGQKINLNFALDRTVTMKVLFYDTYNYHYLGSVWQGLTGGLSISRTATHDSRVQIELRNYSSDPVTVLWATVTL